jgi:hypothetical protein
MNIGLKKKKKKKAASFPFSPDGPSGPSSHPAPAHFSSSPFLFPPRR